MKLCCIVNTIVICTLCNKKWCRPCHIGDRSHHDGTLWTSCGSTLVMGDTFFMNRAGEVRLVRR